VRAVAAGVASACYFGRIVPDALAVVPRCPRSWLAVVGRALLVAMTGAVGSGCAPSLATLQPAHVAPRGHFQVTAGVEFGLPSGSVDDVVESGKRLVTAAQSGAITDEQKWELFDAVANLVASPPSASQHLAIAYTFIDRAEASLRYVGGGFRLGGRYQLLRHEEAPLDLVVGLGVARSTTPIPLGDVLPVLKIDDFTRWTVDVPILAGTSREWFRVWFGPRFLYSRFDTHMRLDLYADEVELASFEGSAFYYGAQAGVALGYRKIFLGVELTVVGMTGSATANTMLVIPVRRTDLKGTVTYPAVGLMGEF
jgi:hypothetical protein